MNIKRMSLASVSVFACMVTQSCRDNNPAPLARIDIIQLPQAVVVSGSPTLYYELHVVNLTTDSLALTSLQIVDADDASVILELGENELAGRFALTDTAKTRRSILTPNASGAIYLEYPQPVTPTPPIVHRIAFDRLSAPGAKTFTVESGPVALTEATPLALGAPLRDGNWAAVYDPTWERGHRRVFYTVDEKMRLPGRFAIDFIRLDDEGHYSEGDENDITTWYGYGNEVLAVSDGEVASLRDDFPESETLADHPAFPDFQATGNFISIDIGGGKFAFYEHLKPGSIRVQTGQRVKKGDVIALLGFTGQTTGPHLHFHIADANSALGAEGLPFVFEKFTVLGAYEDFATFGKAPWLPLPSSDLRSGERPAPNSVITFVERDGRMSQLN